MRTGGADVSLRDVTIALMGNGASKCEWRHAPEARGGFWEFWKSQLVELSPASGENGWLSLARRNQASGLCGGCRTRCRVRWKSQNRKNVYLSPYVEEPLNSKVIKIKCFSCFEIPMFYVYIYMNIMSISHIRIWLCNMGIHIFPKSISPKVNVIAWLEFKLIYF